MPRKNRVTIAELEREKLQLIGLIREAYHVLDGNYPGAVAKRALMQKLRCAMRWSDTENQLRAAMRETV